jgi:hypothetical protein
MGVELEGGWSKLPQGTRLERDASVFHDAPQSGFKVGELPLGPFILGQLNQYMKKYYPDKVDDTCGLHVHMSFESQLYYGLLADSPDYQETMVHYLEKWAKDQRLPEKHPIWERLKGESVYCQKKFWPFDQMMQSRKDFDKVRQGHRYTIVHYCWSRNGTIEIRVLPMMTTVDLAISAVRCVVDVTNAYLMACKKPRMLETGEVILGNGAMYEEVTEIKL